MHIIREFLVEAAGSSFLYKLKSDCEHRLLALFLVYLDFSHQGLLHNLSRQLREYNPEC